MSSRDSGRIKIQTVLTEKLSPLADEFRVNYRKLLSGEYEKITRSEPEKLVADFGTGIPGESFFKLLERGIRIFSFEVAADRLDRIMDGFVETASKSKNSGFDVVFQLSLSNRSTGLSAIDVARFAKFINELKRHVRTRAGIISQNPVSFIELSCILARETDPALHLEPYPARNDEVMEIRAAILIGKLLVELGEVASIRVPLRERSREAFVAANILRSAGFRAPGVTIISCPTCGRTRIDVAGVAKKVYEETREIRKNVEIAVMGCSVNGPGEASAADIGLAGGGDKFTLFMKGRILGVFEEKEALGKLLDLVRDFEE